MSFRESGGREGKGSARNESGGPSACSPGVSKVVNEAEDRERAETSALERTEADTP
jgi:hypothetical protein